MQPRYLPYFIFFRNINSRTVLFTVAAENQGSGNAGPGFTFSMTGGDMSATEQRCLEFL
jgi:hypothetical protein